MKSLYDIPAPAKLNLFLHIVGRRTDGYHLLESVFMLVDWCDTLHFELRQGGHISREDLSVILPEDDLVLRAARALQTFAGTQFGAHIAIDKRIPSQAGMGGGSSDAASTLLALNRLWNLNLGLDTLLTLGLKLGADVPFFLGGHNAWVSGIGEIMTPIALPPARFLIAKPADGLATDRIFSHPELKRDTEPAIISGFAADPYGFGHNDLQAVAQHICPDISQALAWLKSLGLDGRMTGSGSAVFARTLCDTNPQAPPGVQVKQCSNLSVHPLCGWAA
jgi:4-diphosphocytidyl-2-C-methyl-D-erythritol kinase